MMKVSFKKTVIALAVACLSIGYAANADDVNKDSKPYNGKPQAIPGMIVPGCYDQGGADVAFDKFPPFDLKKQPPLKFRADEIGYSQKKDDALIVGGTAFAKWIAYTVTVEKTGEYDVELYLNRPNHYVEKNTSSEESEFIQLDVDGKMLAEWKVSSTWSSGKFWRWEIKPIGLQQVKLTAGEHKLIMRFDRIKSAGFHFGGLRFLPAVFGSVRLPAQAVVFAPFAKEDGVPEPAQLRSVPETLKIGGKQVKGRAAKFNTARYLDCAPFGVTKVGDTSWVFLEFTAESAGPVTFGFGADWWYEAYLDGNLFSETLSGGEAGGNKDWPPSIFNFPTTVQVTAGAHVLAVRMLRGGGSAMLAVGGPEDLRNVALRSAPNPNILTVTKAGYQDGPPPGNKWKLVWSDEFNGTSLDVGKWNELPGDPWKLTGIPTRFNKDNSALDGKGNYAMKLTKADDGTILYGGRIAAKVDRNFGYYEARVQFSTQPGWWTSVCVIASPFEMGDDPFRYPQEFDIYEDFFKPKKSNDIQNCYHANVTASAGGNEFTKTGDGGVMLNESRLLRFTNPKKVFLEQYEGWHTVGLLWTPLEIAFYVDGQETSRMDYKNAPMTTVPATLSIDPCLRAPASPTDKPYFGRIEEAELPDQALVDYVRFYEMDYGTKTAPTVELKQMAPLEALRPGFPLQLEVSVKDLDGKVKSLMLFANGRLRQEVALDSSSTTQTFTLTNLFDGENTIMAMAKDDDGLVGMSQPLTPTLVPGIMERARPFKGTPQKIPGKVRAGYYDEGGRGVAFRGPPRSSDPKLPWRAGEIGRATEDAIPAGSLYTHWVTYTVNVEAAGDYTVELLMNRTNYAMQNMEGCGKIELFTADKKLAEWSLSENWTSGPGWRAPAVSIGTESVHLNAGEQKLLLRFGTIQKAYTHFCALDFKRRVKP